MSAVGRRSLRGALLLSAVLVTSGLVLGAAPQAAVADPVLVQPGELVVNGGAEQSVGVGWSGLVSSAAHGSNGYPASVVVGPTGLTGETFPGGARLFVGSGGASVATQTIDLTPSAAAIDNGHVDALLSAYVGGYANQADNARVAYDFRDAAGTPVESALFGPVMAADRGNVSGFVPFAETLRLPAGTRSVVITITTQRFVAPANDGYVDNISLILDAPSPTAAPDTASTDQGMPVTIDMTTNDAAGTGAVIVPSSLRLLDGTVEVTSLTTAEGTYTVTGSGEIVFEPAADFFGTTAPVRYSIRDSSGQRAESSLTVTVAFVASPGISIVKSGTPVGIDDYVVGTPIVYSFVVTNTGNVRLDDIAISEDAFSGAGTAPIAVCPSTSVEPGAQMTCTASYTLVQADIDNGGVSNTASASGTPAGFQAPIVSTGSTFGLPVTAAPAITLVKSAEVSDAEAAVGSAVAYSFLITNTGNVTVGSVAVTEETFTGTGGLGAVSCSAAQLLPGEFTTCTAGYALTQPDVDAGRVENTAAATAVFDGSQVVSGSSSATVTITPRPAFTFAKTTASKAVTAAGQVVDYVFRVANTGNVTLSNIVIDDTDFTGAGDLGAITCPAPTVAPGQTLDCTARYTVVTADLTEATLSNSASAAVSSGGRTLTGATSTAIVPVDVPVIDVPGSEPGTGVGGSGSGAAGPDRLPNTGGEIMWPVAGGGALILLLGAALLFLARRRSTHRPQDTGRG